MSANPKNFLQEYFQSRNLSLPEYDTGRVGGEDHKPLWVSQVQLEDGTIFVSPVCSSKKQSEKLAAAEALKFLEVKIDDKIVGESWKSSVKGYFYKIYIDVENMSRASLDFLKLIKKIGNPPDYYKFVFAMSRGCSLLNRISEEIKNLNCSNVMMQTTPCLSPDAADIMIINSASIDIKFDKFYIIILSNDRFADTFAQILSHQNNTKVINMISYGELVDFICS